MSVATRRMGKVGFGLRLVVFASSTPHCDTGAAGLLKPEARKPKPERVLYSLTDGIATIFSRRMGICAAGGGDCAFYSPAAGHVLDFRHSVSGMDWGAGLHCGGSDTGRRVAAGIVSDVSAAAADT